MMFCRHWANNLLHGSYQNYCQKVVAFFPQILTNDLF
jgi:hypothetical protein